MLPISTRARVVTPWQDALFTAVSASCVTGLVVRDTATYWSVFGQVVLLLLIQIGGLGVITVSVSLVRLSGRRITLTQRSIMQDSISAPQVGGIVRLTGFILKATLLMELCGTVAMLPVFCSEFGVKGIWLSLFHSVSAFCNAGFDLMGFCGTPYASMTRYAGNLWLQFVLMALIVTGGLGFLTWEDLVLHKFRIRQYRMQSKVIIVMTAVLIFLPALFFFVFEFRGMPLSMRISASLFQSVTTRTAGFNSVDLTAMHSGGQAIMIVLMLIGASPGSTAGGMKITTLAVLLANSVAAFRRKSDTEFFGRRVHPDTVRNASAVCMLYLVLFFSGAVLISVREGLGVGTCLFEAASAVATVGLSLGITAKLGLFSKAILVSLMFLGRVGGLTLVYALLPSVQTSVSKRPLEKISVG